MNSAIGRPMGNPSTARQIDDWLMKAALSALAAAMGWGTGYFYYAAYMTLFTPWGRPTDTQAMLFWTAVSVGITWLLFVLPFVLLVDESSRLLQLPFVMAFGAGAGLLCFLLLIGWWTGFWKEGLYLGYAALIGAATGAAYGVLLRVAGWMRSRSA